MSKLDFQFAAGLSGFGDFSFAPPSAQSAASATSVTFTLSSNDSYTLTGAFTFDATGKLEGGTITGFAYNGALLGQVSNFTSLFVSETAVPVASYLSLANLGDQAGLKTLFFGGNDTVTVSLAPTAIVRTYGGNDSMTDGPGSTLYDGGDGFDTIVFGGSGTPSFARAEGELRVTIGGDTDRLINVETIVAGTKTYFNLSGTDATIARLYSAAFARAPDAAGLAVQENALHLGITPLQLAQNFIASAEFNALYGNVNALSNSQYATALYSNVLGRTPDAAGLAVQIGALDTGLSRPQLLLNFADSAENKTKVTGDWLLA
jgi:hypothetical protein